MCGIIACAGSGVSKKLLDGLKALEYRGYDSAGIGVVGEKLVIVKTTGPVKGLANKKLPDGFAGVAHTRWATHGSVTLENTHPFTDCKGELCIAHNGTIENYKELRAELENRGHVFKSSTDSEVIAHLLEEEPSLEKGMLKAMKELRGCYAVAIVRKGFNGIAGFRKGAPLAVAVTGREAFMASDPSAIPCEKAARLPDECCVLCKPGRCKAFNEEGEVSLKWFLNAFKPGGESEEPFMKKEIEEQPAMLWRNQSLDVKPLLESVLGKERVLMTACGSSWHACTYAQYLLESALRVKCRAEHASEFRYRSPVIEGRDLLLAVSQSGETMDTLEALRLARGVCETACVVNAPGSSLWEEADLKVGMGAGVEVGVASTKAFLAELWVFASLALEGCRQGLVSDPFLVEEAEALPARVEEALNTSKAAEDLARLFLDKGFNNALFLGRGLNYPVALEGALKLKEVSYIHAEGYPAAEMKHGPIALVDPEMPVVFVATGQDLLFEKVLLNMEEVKSRKGFVVTITDSEDERVKSLSNFLIKVPKTHPFLAPLVNVVPLQWLSYHAATLKGLNVDKPRNLAKSVTVE